MLDISKTAETRRTYILYRDARRSDILGCIHQRMNSGYADHNVKICMHKTFCHVVMIFVVDPSGIPFLVFLIVNEGIIKKLH